MKKTIEVIEVIAVFTMRKEDYDSEGLNEELLKDRIQQGIEIPLEDININVKK